MKRRRRTQPKPSVAGEHDSHPLGTHGLDWDDEFAYIAGLTSGGAPYGVSWWEATYLLDDPEFAERVMQAQEEAVWWRASHPTSHDDALASTRTPTWTTRSSSSTGCPPSSAATRCWGAT